MNWYAQREGANDSYFLSANRLAMGAYHAMSQFCFSARIWDFYKVEYLSSHCMVYPDPKFFIFRIKKYPHFFS